ncbi:hypothetical protein [Simiduia litorea]|uniref:hypothetical protein n=1 Tax=Simiduia litorea TaxID=1435348 RepID=UPI0036F2B7E4
MKLKKTAWKLHKYLSYFVFAQIFLWVLGGVVFATVPFTSLVKGGDFVALPASPALTEEGLALVFNSLLVSEAPTSVQAIASAQGPLMKVTYADEQRWISASGPVGVADALQVRAFAEALYRGETQLQDVRWVAEAEPQLFGLVDELSGRTGVWQAKFGDARLYFSAQGEYLKVRTNYWVWYDALWRLHIMDYGDGDNFNNTALRIFTWFAFCFVLTGLVLSFYAFRRTLGWRG